ncbi:MAG: cytochrome-c peroxidase [Bacteroidia bacterium]|nr:MAG: cytochrome-c peroxidase [Bacteroidia bacterium]
MKKVLGILATIFLYACSGNQQANNEQKEHERYDATIAEKLAVFQVLNAPDSVARLDDPMVNLGYHLYHDTRLSMKGNNSCNSCHNLNTFGVDNKPTSPGDEGKNGERNSPTTLNAALHAFQFWDGRAKDVEEQAGMPILNPIEMNIPSKQFLIDRLKKIPLYQDLFKKAFPDSKEPITYENLQKAIGAFERKLITPSRFDKYLAGDKSALTLQEKKGLLAFTTNGCTQCHTGALLGGNQFQKFGVYANYWEHTGSKKIDEGKYVVTKDTNDKYIFKVPSLRNIEKTGPYFHDGSVASLDSAVKIMGRVQLGKEIDEEDTQNIVAFLKSLTSDIPKEYKQTPSFN